MSTDPYRSDSRSDGRSDYRPRNSGGGGGGGRGYGGGRGGNRSGYDRDSRDGGRDGGRGGDYGGRERRGVPLSELDPALTDVSRKVIGAAIEVHKALGPGYPESVYSNALQAELSSLGVSFKAGAPIDVKFRDARVGTVNADLLVDAKFIVEVLARPGDVSSFDRASLRAQLKAADLDLGLVINFAERRLKDGLVRVLNIEKIERERGPIGGSEDRDHDDDAVEGAGAEGVDFDSGR
jgi:GxxExxY protein